jgi:hypothetical protein
VRRFAEGNMQVGIEIFTAPFPAPEPRSLLKVSAAEYAGKYVLGPETKVLEYISYVETAEYVFLGKPAMEIR